MADDVQVTVQELSAALTDQIDDADLTRARGFADLLEIGYQNRPDLFALEIKKPAPLAADVTR